LEDKILKETRGPIVAQNIRKDRLSLNDQKNHVGERLSSAKVLSYASTIWQDHPLMAELMATETSQIFRTIHKRRQNYFSGKSQKRLLSGIFYLLGIKNKAIKSQQEIARCLSTSEATVRVSSRDYMVNFPDLFR
jgi:hypothetical protein